MKPLTIEEIRSTLRHADNVHHNWLDGEYSINVTITDADTILQIFDGTARLHHWEIIGGELVPIIHQVNDDD